MVQIYSLECMLNKVNYTFPNNETSDLIGKVKIGKIVEFLLKYYSTSANGHGTAVLFSAETGTLISAFTTSFKIVLENVNTSADIGTCIVPFDDRFTSTVSKFSETNNTYSFNNTNCSIKDDTGAQVGSILIQGCLIYHGDKIELAMNKFQSKLLIPMPGRSQSYATTEETWKPVFFSQMKQTHSIMDPGMILYAQMAGLHVEPTKAEMLTPEYINKNLCGHKTCPGAKKFKEYGLGPLALGKGLGTITTIKNAMPSGFYGMSQAYGTLDNYGAYGLFVKPPDKASRRYCCASSDCPYTRFYGMKDDNPGVLTFQDEIVPHTPSVGMIRDKLRKCKCKNCGKCTSSTSSSHQSSDNTCGGPLCPSNPKAQKNTTSKPCSFRQTAGADCPKYNCPGLQTSKSLNTEPSSGQNSSCKPCPLSKEQGVNPTEFPPLLLPNRYQVPSAFKVGKSGGRRPTSEPPRLKLPPGMPPLPTASRFQGVIDSLDCEKNNCPNFNKNSNQTSAQHKLPSVPSLPIPSRFRGPFLTSDMSANQGYSNRDNICEGLECPYHVGSGLPGTCPIGSCPLSYCGNKRKLSPRRADDDDDDDEPFVPPVRPGGNKMGTIQEIEEVEDKSKSVCGSPSCWKTEDPEGGDFVDTYARPTQMSAGDSKTKRLSLLMGNNNKKILLSESKSKLTGRQRDILGSLQLSENSDGYLLISRLLENKSKSMSMNNYLNCKEKRRGPCSRRTCRAMKYATCSECGGLSRSGATCDHTNVSFSTLSYQSLEQAPPKKPPTPTKQKQIMGSQSVKKKKQRTRFVYKAGEYYPGLRIGHRTCVIPGRNVPAQMGWLWNAKNDWQEKKNKNWKPGYLNKTIEARIVENRRKKGIPDPPELKMLVKKTKYAMMADSDEEEDEPVIPKPTLIVEKNKEGNYLITMHPLKDPKTLVDREDPYMRCKPIQFLITRPPKKPRRPTILGTYDEIEGEFDEDIYGCLCDKDLDICGSSSSSSDSELNIEFTTPAGLIIPERMKKPPNIVMVDTQFKDADFNCNDCDIIIPEKYQKKRKNKKKK